MDDQGDLFGGREEGRRRRDASMEQADEAADAEWKAAFMNACYVAAKELHWLTTDDVFKRLPKGVDTHERRAAGPRMREAAVNGWIRKSRLPNRETNRPSNHSRPLTVWESLLWGGVYANLDD